MVRKQSNQQVTINKNMRGGDGEIRLEALLGAEELYNKGRLFSRVIVKPGCSIGYHVHENEMEAYHIISGVARYGDSNGETVDLETGDVTVTPAGHGHSIANRGDNDLIVVALIVLQ